MSIDLVKTRLSALFLPLFFFGSISFAADAILPSINLQKSPWTAIALKKGFFKEEFDKIGTKKITLIPQGAAELVGAESAAVGGGSLAIAQRMVYPSTIHRVNGLNTVVIWISEPSNRYRTPTLVAANNKNINSVKDLEGKKFGSSRISCYWSAPFESLNNAGIPFDSRLKKGKVRHENIDNSAVAIAAILSGETDATAVHLAAPAFTGPWLSGKFKIVDYPADDGVYVNHAGRITYVARKDFADKYPNVIKAFLIAREKTRAWAFDHPNEAAEIIAKETRVPLEVALFQLTHIGQWEFTAGEPNANRARTAIKEFLRYYIENGDDILSQKSLTDKEVDAFIDGRFFVDGSHSIYKSTKY
jgi:ABC-type nitrate/sulfonate/bicarbonate transport system substrate-binding protein